MSMHNIVIGAIFVIIFFLFGGVLYLHKLAKKSPSIIRPGEGIVKANYGVPIMYTEGESLFFKDFTMKYLGMVDTTPEGTTASSYEDNFSVKDFQESEQIIIVHSGQLPPKPLQFAVNDISYTLWIYSDSKGNRLKKNQLMVTKN